MTSKLFYEMRGRLKECDRLRSLNAELLAALENIFQHGYDDDTSIHDICDDFDDMRKIARAAIAKAEGK